MRTRKAPRLETRRAAQFAAELVERARAWIPAWGLAEGERDFGAALLDIAARLSSEVAERVDVAGEKMRLGFLDWLAVRGEAARPARVPVVFRLADTAREAVPATKLVRLQADAGGVPVVFETETDVQLVPGRLETVVAVDAEDDAFYLPPPGLASLEPLAPLPTQWRLKTFAAAQSARLQLDPELGIVAGMVVEAGGAQYRVTKVDKDIAGVEPALAQGLAQGAVVRKVTTFAPYGGAAHNAQEHALYLGHMELLNVESAATIEIVGAKPLAAAAWQYWGKAENEADPAWQPLSLAPDDEQRNDAVVLTKDKGAVEPRLVNGIGPSRWIRALQAKIVSGEPFRVDELALRVNCAHEAPSLAAPGPGVPSAAAEAMANTTPLVLDGVFHPLGKEPRQFEAFYLAAEEAFSKKRAAVQLYFEMTDPTVPAFSAVREGAFRDKVLAGIGRDRALHLLAFDPATGELASFRERDPVQPPLPGLDGKAETAVAVPLDRVEKWRLPVWAEGDDFLVAASAGDAVWIWQEHEADPATSGWKPFGSVPIPSAQPSDPPQSLVYIGGATPRLAALRNGRLAVTPLGGDPAWQVIRTHDPNAPNDPDIAFDALAVPIDDGTTPGASAVPQPLVGIATTGQPYLIALDGACTPLAAANVFAPIQPLAVRRLDNLVVAGVDPTNAKLLCVKYDPAAIPAIDELATVSAAGRTFLPAPVEGVIPAVGLLHVAASMQKDQASFLGTWQPEANPATGLFESPIPGGVAGGAPVAFARQVVVPGSRGEVFTAKLDFADRVVRKAAVRAGIVLPDTAPPLALNDAAVLESSARTASLRRVIGAASRMAGEDFYPLDLPFDPGTTGQVLVFRAVDVRSGDVDNDKLKLAANDDTARGDIVIIGTTRHEVTDVTPTAGVNVAKLNPSYGAVANGISYVHSRRTGGREAPAIRISPWTGDGDWRASLLDRADVVFPNAVPERQKGKAFEEYLGYPLLVALGQSFQTLPPPDVNGLSVFIVDAAVGEWKRLLGDTSTNPELSWEYSNGKGWSKLPVTLDATLHLKKSGVLRFTVPSDIVPMDWAGKTHHWIRARLIGGDYGREEVKVVSTETSPGVTEHVTQKSTKGIRAPSAVRLHVSYEVCDETLPGFVLAQDSGSWRDQSDANRTAGAIVEAFVPLALLLGRLAPPGAPEAVPEDCPPPCECPGQAATSGPAAGSDMQPAANAKPASGRAFFVGLTLPPSGGPVNLLFLVDEEREHGRFAPLRVEALVADRFVPVAAEDETRGAGESGLVRLSFAVPPTPRDLFGMTLTWLRLSPAAAGDGWSPILRGAYVNGVWASAAETLTRELLGSSEGAPHLTLTLARPPVLRDTLELRVREPLGEEERAALEREGGQRVLSDDPSLPGDWVLWDRVTDPLDEAPTRRAYALDEEIGEVRFGDGEHGLIPPVGRDSIVAFSYRRTGIAPDGAGTVPGNTIAERTKLNLVSPVPGVEGVFAADHAAGGAPPEPTERVLRFGTARIRHRGRALTARDLEDIALQSSPDIAQAVSFVGRGRVRLVVVMRGANPLPTAAQARELRRLLLAASPAALAAPGALRIDKPAIRRLRVALRLRVASLDHAGAVREEVERRIARLFDTVAGGDDRDGWRLGRSPDEEDVAVALTDLPHLEGIAGIALLEIATDGAEGRWPASIGPADLAMLDADPIRIEFETVEVIA